MNIRINIDDDKRCDECGQGGGVNGAPLCIDCMCRAMEGKPMKSEFGRDYARRVKRAAESKVGLS